MTSEPGMSAVAVHAPARRPFAFEQSLAFLGRFPAMRGEHGLHEGALACAVREAGTLAAVRISAEGDGLRYELHGASGPLGPHAQAAICARLSFFLGLDDDLAAFYALAAGDAPFQAVIERLHGFHHVKFPSPLELLVWSILAQRAPIALARRMKQALVENFTNRVSLDGEQLWAFPDLAQLLTLDEDELAGLIGNRRKASYLHGALRGWAQLDEAFLRRGDHDAVREQLLALPGIGPWSATFVMLRGLGRMERIAPDPELTRAASAVYGHPVSDEELGRLASRYGGWQGYWAHYLRAGGWLTRPAGAGGESGAAEA